MIATLAKSSATRNQPSAGRNRHVPNVMGSEVLPQEWERLLKHFPQHTIFHRLPWLNAIETAHGAKVRLIKAEVADRCVALWPVFALRKGPLRVLGSPLPGWSTPYLGPIFNSRTNQQAVVSALLNHEAFRRYSYFACKVVENGHPVDLARAGFESVYDFKSYCIDLTPDLQTLWDNLKSGCRGRIRKARKLGLEVREEHDSSFLDDYWTMALETFGVCNIKPMFTRSFLEAMWHNLHPNDVRALSAFHNGRRAATLILPFDQHTMYYWSGGSFLRCRKLPAHNLLHWKAIKMAQSMGLQRYDFVSMLGGGGRFMSTFGPQAIHTATHWERTSSRLIRLLKNCYERYQMQRRRVAG